MPAGTVSDNEGAAGGEGAPDGIVDCSMTGAEDAAADTVGPAKGWQHWLHRVAEEGHAAAHCPQTFTLGYRPRWIRT